MSGLLLVDPWVASGCELVVRGASHVIRSLELSAHLSTSREGRGLGLELITSSQ